MTKDLTGKRHGALVAIERDFYYEKAHCYYWKCRCDCGREHSIASSAFWRQESCGKCEFRPKNTGYEKKDPTGQTIKNWKVLMWSHKTKNNMHYWLCECTNCGAQHALRINRLNTGRTTICKCMMRWKNPYKQGQDRLGLSYKHPAYEKWSNMIHRCYNPNYDYSNNYLAKGITVAKEWLDAPNGFKNFLCWLQEKHPDYEELITKKYYQLDRRDNTKGYSPDNCRLTSVTDNCRNKSNNRFIDYKGNKRLLIELAEAESVVSYATLRQRLKKNWPLENALKTPAGAGKRFLQCE